MTALFVLSYMRVTPPLRTAYRPILALRNAYRHIFCLAYCVPFKNKNDHFWRFQLHNEYKMTVCYMHMYNHSSFDVFACYIS